MIDTHPFDSFFGAGFECSSHRRKDGVRLDLIRATGHDLHARADYEACAALGLKTVRDGLRWHRIELAPGLYNWSSWLPMVAAAEAAGVQIVWDLYHYGAPDHHDPRGPEFPQALAAFAAAATRVHLDATGRAPFFCPVNEISFFAWAVGKNYIPLAAPARASWFKRQLVRAAIAACDAVREIAPGARFAWAEPLVHVAPRNRQTREVERAQGYRLAQFEAYDMLVGDLAPELGGRPDLVDLVGLNFYPHNQWYCAGSTIPLGHHEYRPLAEMLVEASLRYRRPLWIAETGAEGSARPAWLHYVCDEVRTAKAQGTDVRGICLYPVTAYPGWDNGRHAEAGLFSVPLSDGARQVFQPLADELERQRGLFAAADRPVDGIAG